MSDDIAMSDASAPSIHDASKPVAMEDLIRDKTCDLRTLLHKYHAINASRIGRLADELKYLGLTGPVGEHLKIIKAHRAFGKMIDEEQREVDRRGELVRYVAYCQAVKLRLEGKAGELGLQVNVDVEGDVAMDDEGVETSIANGLMSSRYARKERTKQMKDAIDELMGTIEHTRDREKQGGSKSKKSKKSKSKKSKREKKEKAQVKPSRNGEREDTLSEAERSRIASALAKLGPLEQADADAEMTEGRATGANGAPQWTRSTRKAALLAQVKIKQGVHQFMASGRRDKTWNDIKGRTIWGSAQSSTPLVNEGAQEAHEAPGLMADDGKPEKAADATKQQTVAGDERVPLKRKRAQDAEEDTSLDVSAEERPAKMTLAYRLRTA